MKAPLKFLEADVKVGRCEGLARNLIELQQMLDSRIDELTS